MSEPTVFNPDALTDLFDVVAWGDLDRIVKIIKDEISPQTFVNVACSLLHLAANHQHSDIVEYLLANRTYVDSLDANMTTPLMLAARHGDVETVQILLAYAANINAVDYDLRTPLYFAAYDGRVECVNTILIQPDLDISIVRRGGWTPLHEAAKFGHKKVVKALLGYGVDIMARTEESFMTAGHLAIAMKKIESVKLLLKAGMPVDTVGGASMSSTMLHEACRRGVDSECIQLLLDNGADLFRYDGTELPTHIACASRHAHTLDFLLTYAEDHGMPHLVDALTNDDLKKDRRTNEIVSDFSSTVHTDVNNALCTAAYLGLEECMKVLLKHKASHVACGGKTPVILAVSRLHMDCLKLLLCDLRKRGHEVVQEHHPTSASVQHPLFHLCKESHNGSQNRLKNDKFIACSCLLLNSGIGGDINQLENGQSCLEAAASAGSVGLVNHLLSSGADPNINHMPLLLKQNKYVAACCELIEDSKYEAKSLLLLSRIALRKWLTHGVGMDYVYQLPLPRMLKDYVYHGHYNVGGVCNLS